MKFSEINSITGGELIELAHDQEVTHLLIDSRKLVVHPGAIFFAIKGPNHNGHHFLDEVYKNGITQFIVQEEWAAGFEVTGVNVIRVPNVIRALQDIASYRRSQVEIPVIGITGSNGKTMVKEWLFQLLSDQFNIIRSPKSYNSQVGVPISVWPISEINTLGIFEAGISQSGEMDRLQPIIDPTIGIITNIGSAHAEGFSSIEQKLNEKLRLFANSRVLIYCKDHELIDATIHQLPNDNRRVFKGWSLLDSKSDFYFETHDQLVLWKGHKFLIPIHGQIALENILHSIVAALALGVDHDLINQNLQKLQPVRMRLEVKQGINDSTLIDDTYNNDLNSLEIALDFMNQQLPGKSKTVILSDILQSGISPEQLYRRVNDMLLQKGINRLITVGEQLEKYAYLFQIDISPFADTESLLSKLNVLSFSKEAILVKGARSFTLEKVIDLLQEKIHATRLEVNLNHLTNNLNFFRSRIDQSTKVMVMVKALAYGGGAIEIASLLQFHKVDYLAVAYPDEGVVLRQAGITLPIMVLNAPPDALKTLIDFDLQPEIYSTNQLNTYSKSGLIKGLKVHLKFNTGMNRLGLTSEDIPVISDNLRDDKVEVISVFSHLSASEEMRHDSFTLTQIDRFEKLYETLSKLLGYHPLRHILNTAGITRFPQHQMDMVRLGIGLYGFSGDQKLDQLSGISSLKSSITQIRTVKAGESVGYNRAFVAQEEHQIAIIPIGYADGYDRRFGRGQGYMMVADQRAPVVGNVCMDMTMIDVTGIDAKEGDEVVVFGEGLSVKQLADTIGTIPYEILTNVGERVKRVFLTE